MKSLSETSIWCSGIEVSTKNLDKLKQKRSQINARIQKLEASEKAKSRKQETRRLRDAVSRWLGGGGVHERYDLLQMAIELTGLAAGGRV